MSGKDQLGFIHESTLPRSRPTWTDAAELNNGKRSMPESVVVRRSYLAAYGARWIFAAALVGAVVVAFSSLAGPIAVRVDPAEGMLDVRRDVTIRARMLPLLGRGVDPSTATPSTVLLYPSGRPLEPVPTDVHVQDGGRELAVRPIAALAPHTAYVLEITDGLRDLGGKPFRPQKTSFRSGAGPGGRLDDVQFERVMLPGTEGRHTSVAFGPDGKLYATSLDGVIRRWSIDDDGALKELEVIPSLWLAEGSIRLLLGFAFDPAATADNLIAWVSHSTYGFNDQPDWGGKITRLSGPDLEVNEDYVTHLPRSTRDHATNGLAFGPDGALYVSQGSNTSFGDADEAWGNRPERLLSAAVLRVDVEAIAAAGTLPIDVKTDEGGTYTFHDPAAPVTVFAGGVRNAYDLAWHSNGYLYVPNNGSARGGGAPASVAGTIRPDGSPYSGPSIPALVEIDDQEDVLLSVPPPASNGAFQYRYYGHPNPARGEYVLDGGNPSDLLDAGEAAQYPEGISADEAWGGFVHNFGAHKSPNGIIEYRGDAFGGALKGYLIVAMYSSLARGDIAVLKPDATGGIVQASDVLGIPGLTGFSNPLDLVENPKTGHLYVIEFGGSGSLVLLRPATKDVGVVHTPDQKRKPPKLEGMY